MDILGTSSPRRHTSEADGLRVCSMLLHFALALSQLTPGCVGSVSNTTTLMMIGDAPILSASAYTDSLNVVPGELCE